jgi:hypothetical protein
VLRSAPKSPVVNAMAQLRDSFPEPGDGGGGAVLEAGVGDRDAVALAVERLASRDCLRFCFGRMQAVMPRSARAAGDGLLS